MKQRFQLIAIIFILLILAPVALNKYYDYSLKPVSSQKNEKIFVVKPDEPFTKIASGLKEQNLIKNSFAFKLLVSQMGISKNIQAGDFRLSGDMGAKEIATLLTHGAIDVWITFPEGQRIEQQAAKIEEKLKFGQNKDYQFDKKEYIKLSEEGYMFPDTYLIAKDASSVQIAKKLRDTFTTKVESEFLKNNQTFLSSKEVVTLASIIEREAKNDAERAKIAGVLMNRLNNNLPLQVDATVQYARGYDSSKNTWWPEISTSDYHDVKSPYNTYLFPGLPPGPICNPGIASIKAALSPEKNDYYYYLHDSRGNIHFAKTIDEHNDNIRKFL